MPELPEVETIARSLREGKDHQPSLIGHKITGAQVLWERSIAEPTAAQFETQILGQCIEQIRRRGKYLLFQLSLDTLLIHLRMSGDLLLESSKGPIAPHHRVILDTQDTLRLAFNDTRKFGRVWLTDEPETVLGSIGPEPLDDSFSAKDLHIQLKSRQRQLKPLLMDQSFIAGLGNIYTDEALHLAQLHPLTRSNSLTFEQANRLWVSIREVLQIGIQKNGASIDWVYRGGDFQNYFRVYQRTGQPCPKCGHPIQRIVVGQRSTHFCSKCQEEK